MFIHCSYNSKSLKKADNQSYSLIGSWKCQEDGIRIQIMLQDFIDAGINSQDETGFLTRTRFRNIDYLGENKWRCEQCLDLPLQLIPIDTSRLLWLEAIIEMINEESFKIAEKVYMRY